MFLKDARFQNFDELANAIEGWDLDWLQLDRGSLDAGLQQMGTASALLTRVEFSRKFHQRGSTPPGFLTFGLMGQQVESIRFGSQIARTHELVFFPSGDEFDVLSSPGFTADTFSFSEEVLGRAACSLGLPDLKQLLGDGDALACEPTILSRIRARIRAAFESAALHASGPFKVALREEVEEEIPSLLLEAIASGRPGGESISTDVRSRTIRKAQDFVAAESRAPLTVQQVCHAVGISKRTLEYAFHEHLGVTPKQYLQSTRLSGVRRDLLRADSDVKIVEVGNSWGFWHMGQFAADYRRQFGELPSETLARI